MASSQNPIRIISINNTASNPGHQQFRGRWQWAAAMGLNQSRDEAADESAVAHPFPRPSISAGDKFWRQLHVSADKVLPHLFIGNYSSGCNKEFLEENNITRILNMTPEPHTDLFPNVEYLDLGLEDMRSADISVFFDEGHQFLTRAREDGAVALVHCHMGISRATTMAMAHILLSGKIYDDPDEHARNAARKAAAASASGVSGDTSAGEGSIAKEASGSAERDTAVASDSESMQAAASSGADPTCTQVTLVDVWELVHTRRTIASPNMGFIQHLQQLEMRLAGIGTSSLNVNRMF